jgi:hypothetical protein
MRPQRQFVLGAYVSAVLAVCIYVAASAVLVCRDYPPPLETRAGRYVGLIAGGSLGRPHAFDPMLVVKLSPRRPPVWIEDHGGGHDASGWEPEWYPSSDAVLIRLAWLPLAAGFVFLLIWRAKRKSLHGRGFPVGA